RIDGVQEAPGLGIVIADGGAPGEAALGADGAGGEQERLGQQGFSSPGVADQGNVPYVAGGSRHPFPRPSAGTGGFFKKDSALAASLRHTGGTGTLGFPD